MNVQELVVIRTQALPHNVLLSTSANSPVVLTKGTLYVWREGEHRKKAKQDKVSVHGNPEFQELVVVESREAPRNVLLSTSDSSPLMFIRDKLYVWRGEEGAEAAT